MIHSYVPKSKVFGREEEKQQILKLLTNKASDKNIFVLAIVGIGGLSKSTLAQLVYGDVRAVQHFDLRIWV